MTTETAMLPDRYRDPQRIGRGGMGDIYHATDETLGRPVAIKVLAERYSEDGSVRMRFTREALAAAKLSGEPHTVTIFDVGEWEERPFIVMEYLPGGSLEEVLRKGGAAEPAEALAWLEQAAQALDHAHSHGIVHRDVKPGNLLLDRGRVAHVADFGIASATGMDSMTKAGTVLGTAGYLSPEQASGERATPASDRYALGIVAFELLTGGRPFASESPTAEATAHVNAPIPSASARRPDLPLEIDRVLARALAKEPGARYLSCAELVSALRAALDEAAGTTGVLAPVVEPTRTRRPAPARRPRSLLPFVLGGALLAALAGIGVAAALSGRDDDPSATPSTVVRTLVTTAQGEIETREVTVTAEPPPPPAEPPPAEPPPSPPATADPVALTDQSTALIREGAYEQGLAVALQALETLAGSGELYEAYASYNAGKSLLELGRCAEAIQYFDRSEAIQGKRGEITRDRKAAERCAEGEGDD